MAKMSSKIWNAQYINLLAIEVIFQFATYMLNPVVAGYVVTFGASLAVGGFIAGLVALSALAARPLTGLLADWLSKSSLLILAAGMFAAAAFGCAMASNEWVVGLFRVVQGIAFAMRSAVVVSLVSVVVDREYIGRAVGWIGAAQMVACALAPSVSTLIGSYRESFYLAGALYSVGLLLAVVFRISQGMSHNSNLAIGKGGYGERRRRGKIHGFLYKPSISFSVMAALAGVPHAINVSLIFSVGEARGLSGISIYFAAYAVAALLVRPIAGRVSDLKGYRAVMMPALLIDLLGSAVLVHMNSIPMVILAGLFVGVGQGASYSTLQAESVRRVPLRWLGRASNTFYIGPDINMGITPFIAGLVMAVWGVTPMYEICLTVIVASIAYFAISNRAYVG